ncbi:arsenate reductase (glutaredoxin) [Sulfitobacter sp. M57]|uniref:arsenate reductase (glutaredoxin) n=1 Tax=unclassified Sulfitobacter TaxID=196795 RepID=UPI0023E2D433|nr:MULTISPECIES: arsenate reductase (glutaredoxin) [unclassified Sulfitobacter]MDF3415682.1 arsenate reductase (glutaredoxin) [Sulfitobacter sp. KE5]MDF3423162.1 arsenate reductase (glutaredoxin) [Sulfitobacter sp. KE43]MDF3434228.1 arsenate reductase (glutaredoxin) [Sulfitobacter sp. KE42]MDF3459739.1 arsenate reductase (glutaredoxin) [Sulfitobacter sp. S74]MDF3463766.1 arsenate reductase (glutaredoxin) [Sulfitobacter sp. Ks18]
MITLWHNPRCSKSRQTLALIEAAGAEVTPRLYLQDAPSLAEIEQMRRALGNIPAIKMMRPGEKLFKELELRKDMGDDALVAAMAAHPILIERPIACKNGQAVIGRPPEAVEVML